MERCIELTTTGELPTLLQMAHVDGNEQAVVSLVTLNIAALDEYLHLNNRMTELEMDSVAYDIVHVYGGALSFADLNLILTTARRGGYGRFFERLSAVDILTWVSEYYDRRLEESVALVMGERDSREERKRERGVMGSDASFQLYKETTLPEVMRQFQRDIKSNN